MAVELEGLEFQIEAKSEEGTKGVDALTASLGKLKKATKGGLGLNSKVKELNKLNEALKGFHSDKLESLGKALESLNVGGKATISPTIPKRLNEIGQALDNITLGDIERLEDLGKALRELKEVGDVKIPKVKVPSTGVAPTMNTPAGEASAEAATSSVEQATSSVQEANSALRGFKGIAREVAGITGIAYPFNQLKQTLSSVPAKIKQVVGHLHELYDNFKKTGGVVGMFGRAIGNVFKKSAAGMAAGVKAVTSTLGKAFTPSVHKATGAAGKFFASIKRIAMYRLIRMALSAMTQAMKEGINNLYRYSTLMGGTFAQSMDRLATSGQYLKNSLGAMAAPIINALAPAIDFVIDKIVTLLNFINMLFARLSGASSFTAAKKNATSYGDSLEKAGGSAAKAAKEIRDATTGIDELNIIMQKDDAGSGGGGGGGTDYGSMFEELPIDNSVSDFADKLKQAFDNANWRELGTLIGGKVNEVIDSINWEGVGHKIGYWINAAVQTAYWFLKTVDFHNLGEHVAEMLNGALEEVDTSFIGRIIVRWFTAKFDFILGALGGLDWGLIARKVSDCIKGAFDEATEWLNGYDWSQMGKDLWANIKEVVTNIDWGGIAESIFTFLGTAIRSAVQFLGSIGADIKNWWDTEIAGQDWKETAGNLLSAIGEGFLNIGNWVYEHIIDPFCTALLGENVWADVKQAGSDMWAGFTKGITDFFNDPGGWIKTNIVDPFVSWIKNLFGIHSPSTVMAEIGGYIIEGLLNGILAPFKNIGNWVKKHIVDPLVEAVKNSPVISFVVDVVNNAGTWWKNVKEWWKNVSANGVSLSAFVGLLKSGWTTVKDWIGSIPVISQAVSLVKSGWNTVKKWVGELPTLEQAIRLVKSGWETVATWIGNLPVIKQAVSLLKSGWTTVRNWIGNLPTISQTISLLKSGWTTVKNWIGNIPVLSQAISLIKSGWSTVKNWIGTLPIISQGISLLKSGWTSVKNWIGTSTVSVGISLFKSGWSSLSNFVGNTVSVGISLFKSGWSSIKSFFGLSSGGYNSGHGWKFFEKGGFIDNGQAGFWDSIPKYANGTANAHGSMFVAGEAGPEVVGHVNGRSEVLNKSQLGQVMHRSIVDGMTQFAGYWKSINTHMTTCSNAIISAVLVSADTLYENTKPHDGYDIQDMNEWIDKVASRVSLEVKGAGTTTQFTDGVRDGVAEATARQNQLLKEQNELLQRLVGKETVVQIGNRVIKEAVVTQEKADGYRFTK